MVRLKAPMFSLDASGTVANAVVFSSWKGRAYGRRHAIPANPKSGLQVGVRSVFKFLTQDYANLAAGDLSDWQDLALADNITRLNAQIRDGVDRGRRNLGWRENTTDVDPGAIDAVTGAAATPQPKSLVLDWIEPVANPPDYCYAIYHSIVTAFTPDVSNLIAIVKFPGLTWTHKGLTSGVEQFYRIRGLSTSGFLGTLCAQFSETPD